jgi:hypothetical protein
MKVSVRQLISTHNLPLFTQAAQTFVSCPHKTLLSFQDNLQLTERFVNSASYLIILLPFQGRVRKYGSTSTSVETRGHSDYCPTNLEHKIVVFLHSKLRAFNCSTFLMLFIYQENYIREILWLRACPDCPRVHFHTSSG